MKFIKDDYEIELSSLSGWGYGFRPLSPQAKEFRADGKPRVETVDAYQRCEIELPFERLTEADYGLLLDFVLNRIDFALEEFVFEDWDGVQWPVRFISREYDFRLADLQERPGQIKLVTQPPPPGWGRMTASCFRRFFRGPYNPGKPGGSWVDPADVGMYFKTTTNYEDKIEACWCRSAAAGAWGKDFAIEFDIYADAIDYIESQTRTWNAPGLVFGMTKDGVGRAADYGSALTGLFFQLRAGRAARSGLSLRVNHSGSWQSGQLMLFEPLQRFTTTRVRISVSAAGLVQMLHNGASKLSYQLSDEQLALLGKKFRREFGAATVDTATENYFGSIISTLE